MKLVTAPKPVLAICLNPAWQKTLTFTHLTHGDVNRASALHECGGGKTTNVVRVFRKLGQPITMAYFMGGATGQALRTELDASGAGSIAVATVSATRTCITLISQDNSEVSELIEPAGPVAASEAIQLQQAILDALDDFSCVVCSGSVPPGIAPEFTATIASACVAKGIPFVLDAFKGIIPSLEAGVRLLKINTHELRQLTGQEDIALAGKALLEAYPHLANLAVTDGPAPAWLFNREGTWTIQTPSLPRIVSAIGGGDCATAIMTWRIAEGATNQELPQAFAEACACASASCLTDTPSLFSPQTAQDLLANTTIVQR